MKRMFVIAVLTSTVAIPSGAALAGKGLGGGAAGISSATRVASSIGGNTGTKLAANNLISSKPIVPQGNVVSNNTVRNITLPNNLAGNTLAKNNFAKAAADVLPNGGQPGGQQIAPQGGQQGINPNLVNKGLQGQNLNPAGPRGLQGNPGNLTNGGNLANGGPQGIANGGTSFLKGFKEMHGRMDGQSIILGGAKVTGGIAVKKDCKAPEHCHEMVNYVFNYCRFKSGCCPCGPCMPMGLIEIGWMPGPPAPFGDLELVNVGMVADATPEQGPIYRVTMFNNSPMASRDFHVSMVAVLGEINDSAVVVTVPVKEVAPNATTTIDVQLPVNAMAMGNPAAAFDTLIVAVDSFDELAETNELNNVATITRTEVVSVTVRTEGSAEVVQTGAAVAAPAVAAPATGEAVVAPTQGVAPAAPADPNAPPVAAPEQPAAPAAPAAPAQGGNLDLDNVDGASQLLDR